MAETETIVEDRKITYEGLFSVSDLYRLIDEYFAKIGYDKVEVKNVEVVKPEGKFIEIRLEPYKTITDYVRYVVSVRIICSEIKEVEIKRDGHKLRLNSGKAQIIVNGYLLTDWEGKWESKPVYYVLRALMNKYVFQPITGKYKGEIAQNCEQLVSNIKAFLNLYRY
ncbi:hypothetical protein HY641_02240 [Candidatus Woesearchaeota archaeon]|nr:hypothetical protein [Candidatus Woesearchaeota archaeon]